jgi:hypothetical protein
MAAPSIVQVAHGRSTASVASLDVSFSTAPTVGRLIVAFGFTGNALPTSIADNKSNTYTQRESEGYGLIWGKCWSAPATTSGGTFTLTLTPTASTFCAMVLYEVANWNTSPVIEKNGRQWATGASGTYSPLNFTATSAAEQLFLACLTCGNTANDRSYTPGSGWVQDALVSTGTGLKYGAISQAATSAGTYDPEWVMDAGGSQTLALGVSFVGGTEGPLGSSFIPRRTLLGVG